METTFAQGLRKVWENIPSLRNVVPTESLFPYEIAYNDSMVPYGCIADVGTIGSQRDHDQIILTKNYRIRAFVRDKAGQDKLLNALYDLERVHFTTRQGRVEAMKVGGVRAGRDNQGVRSLTATLTVRLSRKLPHVRTFGV